MEVHVDYAHDRCQALSEKLAPATGYSMILLLGDVNAKHEQWDPSSTGNAAGHAMASLLTDFSLYQCVTTPTRYTSDGLGSSVLDLLARALILFCLKALGKNEKWHHFCAHAQW